MRGGQGVHPCTSQGQLGRLYQRAAYTSTLPHRLHSWLVPDSSCIFPLMRILTLQTAQIKRPATTLPLKLPRSSTALQSSCHGAQVRLHIDPPQSPLLREADSGMWQRPATHQPFKAEKFTANTCRQRCFSTDKAVLSKQPAQTRAPCCSSPAAKHMA
jgi:hypothetical protein